MFNLNYLQVCLKESVINFNYLNLHRANLFHFPLKPIQFLLNHLSNIIIIIKFKLDYSFIAKINFIYFFKNLTVKYYYYYLLLHFHLNSIFFYLNYYYYFIYFQQNFFINY